MLFAEPGARWRSVAYGPVLCAILLVVELATGARPHWFALIFCGVAIGGFVALQVVAGQRHVSVELTPEQLRQGTELLPLRDIAAVLPERDDDNWDDLDWESARALGELHGVPRRRTGVGLKLRNGALVQGWARDHRGLRAALEAAVADAAAKPAEPEEPAARGAAAPGTVPADDDREDGAQR
ncbi:hypothetical protein [Nocardia jiangsuensis]|uniref:DUF3093 family protein n=1 Tax=Nocardia jiangsuensis TaxID=1691563 RepID=A0ABV8DU62_9NOCA